MHVDEGSGAQYALERALQQSDLPWWEWDVVGNKVTFNALKVTMLGYLPQGFEGCGFEAFTALLHPEDHERTMQAMRNFMAGRAEIYQVDYRIRCASGAYTWYMDRGYALERDAEGRMLRLRGLVVDLGAELHAHAESMALVKLLRRALPDPEGRRITTVCSTCTKLRISDHLWLPVGDTFQRIFDDTLSHGICPDCLRRLYPEHYHAVMGED